jgi:hypothetical protein
LRWFLAACLTASMLTPTAAQDTHPGRFSVTPAEHGFIRLDTRTGNTTHCTQNNGMWTCRPVIEDAGALAGALRALDERVDALAANLGDEDASDAMEPEHGNSLMASAIERLLEFVRILKYGRAGDA